MLRAALASGVRCACPRGNKGILWAGAAVDSGETVRAALAPKETYALVVFALRLHQGRLGFQVLRAALASGVRSACPR